MLTVTKLNSLKPQAKPYKVSDAHGLYIYVRPTGTKSWRQKYRFNGKEKLLTHGKYPLVSLVEARELRDKALRLLHEGVDPSLVKLGQKLSRANTFGVIAKEWHEKESINWKPSHSQKVWRQLESDILKHLRDSPIDSISPTELLSVLEKIEKRGALDIASRQRQRCEAIFRHAILTERASHNPATQLVGVMKTKRVEHRKALKLEELPEFLDQLERTSAHQVVKIATKILIHTFVRTGELRGAKWDEIDFDKQIWSIPAERMKMGREHLVPLSEEVVSLLKQVKDINGQREYVFASPQRPKQPLSENAILNLIYRMGYKGKATGHGFRATASSALNEMGHNPDAIERQLSHTEKNKVKAAYNRAEYFGERKKIMECWSKLIQSNQQKIL